MELIKKDYQKADELVAKNYTELKRTNTFMECDSIAISHENKDFWFTTEKTFNKTFKKDK